MNWLAKALQVITLTPGIVQAIEIMHGQAKSGTDKKTLALKSLGLADSVFSTLDPAEAPAANAVASLAGGLIDSTVSLFNQIGWTHTPAAAPVVAAPVPSPAAVAAAASPATIGRTAVNLK